MIKEEKDFLKEYLKLCEKHNLQIAGYGGDILITHFKDNYYDLIRVVDYELEDQSELRFDFDTYNEDQLTHIKNRIDEE